MVDTPSTVFDRVRLQADPLATPGGTVICGSARFTILTSRLLRLEWSPSAQFEDRSTFAFPTRHIEKPEFSCEAQDHQITINTGLLSLRYTDNGSPFDKNNLTISFDLDGKRVTWKPGMVNLGNLRGTARTLDQCAGATSLQEGILSREGWSVFDDSGSPVWTTDGSWVEARPDSHVQDWYFFGYGHDYKAALRDYMKFGGPIPLVPRYVLGAWWSRFWAYHADDLANLVRDFDAHDIPLDVLVIDMDWHTPDGWTGYTWNRQLFPDPEAFLSWVHSQGLHATLNLHPAEGVKKHEAAYTDFARALGQNPALGVGIKFSSTDKAFVQNYFELLHHPMEEQGVDFWWVDWQQGEASDIKNLDPLPWLNHLHFHDATRRGKRPMLYSRWGGLGNHRYPIGFSGDAYATWDSLRFQPYFTATAANVGYGWWSHDIGGHFGATDPELYARWVQFGAVSPCLRLHATKDPLAERRPWAFPDAVYEAAKTAIQFRYRLLPYLYSAARNLSEQGLSLCYPMYYDYPDVEDAYLAREQYFLGDQMFVAPVVQPSDPQTGLAPVDVWIPAGTWIEYSTLEAFSGPRWIRVQADLNRIPMFVREGAILPMAPGIKRTAQADGSHIVLEVFSCAHGHFDLYEDDGTTDAYKHGDYEVTAIDSTCLDSKALVITISGAQGHCSALSPTRTLEIHARSINRPNYATVNAMTQPDWSYDEQAREAVLVLHDVDRYSPIDVVLTADKPLAITSTAAPVPPNVHVVDEEVYDGARIELGTLVIAPPSDHSPFGVDVVWTLYKGSAVTSIPAALRHCAGEQILHCPFADDASLATFRWTVSATVTWAGQAVNFAYDSPAAYPSLNHWRTLIYNRDAQPPTMPDTLPWHPASPLIGTMLNIRQPFGLVLLEQERQRISSGEPLEACVATTLFSQSDQDAILCVQCVGEHSATLNGVSIMPGAPLDHETLQPMFYSWMPPTLSYYAVSLRPGPNQLVLFTQPKAALGWWGIGATLFDTAGKVLTAINEVRNEPQ